MNRLVNRMLVSLHIKMKIQFVFLIVFLFHFVFLFESCNHNSNTYITEDNARKFFAGHSHEDGAKYYSENRIDNIFLDNLYRDSIIPKLEYCNYYELKAISAELQNTPVSVGVDSLLALVRTEMLNNILGEMNEILENEFEIFISEVVPVIQLGIDSIISKNAEDLCSEYSGGILNSRKLLFFTGRNQNAFIKMWDRIIDPHYYSEYFERLACEFLSQVCYVKQQYIKDITGKSLVLILRNPYPLIGEFKISNNLIRAVRDYTDKEKKEISQEVIKEWIAPAAIGALTGGFGAMVYEIGSFGYDIKTIIDDVNNQKADPETMLVFLSEDEIYNQLMETYLKNCYAYTKAELRNITNTSFKYIEKNL